MEARAIQIAWQIATKTTFPVVLQSPMNQYKKLKSIIPDPQLYSVLSKIGSMTSSFPNIPNGSDHASLIPHDLGGNSRSMAAITILSNLENKWRQIFKAINSSRLDNTMVTFTEPRWPLSRRLQKEGNIVFWMSQVCTQRARKFEKVQAKKLVKSNKSFFFVKLHFGQFF